MHILYDFGLSVLIDIFSLKSSRLAAFDLLLELSRESEKNFTELQNLLLKHHSSGKAFT